MWIFLSNAFVSVVADRRDRTRLLVRARLAEDLARVFPDADVAETPAADYRFRASVPRAQVANAIARQVRAIRYDNFKGSVPVGDDERHDAYLGVWGVMHRLQESRFAKKRDPRVEDLFGEESDAWGVEDEGGRVYP